MADARGIAELKVDGQSYGGWKTMAAESGIEQISGAFHLDVTDRWADQPEPRPIKRGAAAQLLLDGEPVITGYVDDTDADFDELTHSLTVTGRDKTADLVDCSAIYGAGQWKGATLDRIARDLIAPYGIALTVQADVGTAFTSFNIQEGESVFATLDRAARMRAVLLTSDSNGGLLITRAANEPIDTQLVLGQNLKRLQFRQSWKERFSEYRVKGQGKGSATVYGKALRGYASTSDSVVDRYRPLIVLSEQQSGQNFTLQQRIDWERNVRIGRGTRATATVQGWRHRDGLWRPNTLVSVRADAAGIDEQLLVVKVSYSLTDTRGTITELELTHPLAFALLSGIEGTRLNRAIKGRDGVETRRRNEVQKAKRGKRRKAAAPQDLSQE